MLLPMAAVANDANSALQPLRVGIGVGFESTPTTTLSMRTISVLTNELTNFQSTSFRAGAIFGFDSNFNFFIAGPKIQYFLAQTKNVGIFTQLTAYVRSFQNTAGIGGNILGGFELSIPTFEDLKIAFGYGFVWDAVNINSFGMDNVNNMGNIQVHYFF